MKRIIFILMAGALINIGYAQKKPKIGQAETAWKEGRFDEAKDVADAASEFEKTKEDPKVWFVRGLVYASLDTTSNESYSSLAVNPLSTSLESFNKAKELRNGDEDKNFVIQGGFPIPQSQIFIMFWGHYINEGVGYFQTDEASKAADYFEKSQLFAPDSLMGYYYAGLAAYSIEEYDRAYKNFDAYIQRGGDDIDAYERAIHILANVNDEKEKALGLLRDAKKKFPESSSMREQEFRLLYSMNKIDEAIEQLKAAINSDPDNAELHFNLGVIYDQSEKPELAYESYMKALDADPEYLNALFNVGVYYRNQIVEKNKEKSNLGISKADMARGKAIDADLMSLSKKALPYWEKCDKIKPDDQTTLETLQYIYLQVKDYDKAEVITERMEKLGFK